MYAARRTGLKKEMFGYVPGGYARILECFSQMLIEEGVKIKLGVTASKVEGLSNGRVSLELESKQREAFDQAVFTGPAPVAASVSIGLSAEEITALNCVQYQWIICASLLLKQPLTDFYVTNITDKEIPFTAVIDMSALVDRRRFGVNALVYLPKYVAPDDPAFRLPEPEIEQRFMDAVRRMYPHFKHSDLISFHVSRVRNVFPIQRCTILTAYLP